MSLSLPGTPVPLERRVADELDAAVGNALDNVRSHAGPGARAFVLLEDLGDSVTVSIRDDGVGIAAAGWRKPPVKDAWASRSRSWDGWHRWAATRNCAPRSGEGTEWELRVPRVKRDGSWMKTPNQR